MAAKPARNFCGKINAQLVTTVMRLHRVKNVAAKMGLHLTQTKKLVAPPTVPSALRVLVILATKSSS